MAIRIWIFCFKSHCVIIITSKISLKEAITPIGLKLRKDQGFLSVSNEFQKSEIQYCLRIN